ncbi:hypothetical protein IEZ26_05515 [Nocardioides cavernae]|uniref:Uncharacterized protein n=1 Tax=Nocardioides cavernae TaxID=1921566 RepID=A0ABR8N875_9ACTN|nr:hypothetical protein [Nocardioides cavernae]MBD3924070.1 hypothetical protein [Nocardioides cavernae]MBM7510992.1 hypothetical protein [Nocardioides cavernae]
MKKLLCHALLLTALVLSGLSVAPPASAAPGPRPDVFTAARQNVTSPTTASGNVLANDDGSGLVLDDVRVTQSAIANTCFQVPVLLVPAPEVVWNADGQVSVTFADQWPSGLPSACVGRIVRIDYVVRDDAGQRATGSAVLVEDMPSGGHTNPDLVATKDSVLVRTRGQVRVEAMANDRYPAGTRIVAAGQVPGQTQLTVSIDGAALLLDSSPMTSTGTASAGYLLRTPAGELAYGGVELRYEPPAPMLWDPSSILNLCSICTQPIRSEVRNRFRMTGIRVVPGTTRQVPLPGESGAKPALTQADASVSWNGDNLVQPSVRVPQPDLVNGPVSCPDGDVEQVVMVDVDIESVDGSYEPRTYRVPYDVISNHEWVCLTSPPRTRLAPLTSPEASGRTLVGRTVRVRPGTWSVATTPSYQWFVGKPRVRGAKGAERSLRLTRAMRGQRVSVKVTVRARGFSPYVDTFKLKGRVR